MTNANDPEFGRKCQQIIVFGCVLAGNAVIWSSSAMAEDWVFAPYVGISEQYTDNAFSTASDRKGDFITSLNAGFALNKDGNHLQLRSEYDGSYDIYSKYSDLNGFRHNLLAGANAELVPEHLFVDSQIAFTEQTLTRSGNTTIVDRTVSGDRTRVLNTRISPYYMQNFGGAATGIARYTYSRVDFFDAGVGSTTTNPNNSETNQIDLTMQSGSDFSRTKWAVEGLLLDNQVDSGNDLRRASIKGTGQMPINNKVAALGTVGWDEFDGENIDNEEISGAFYGGGVRLTPGPRTDFSIQVGHRYGGGVVDADLTYLISTEALFFARYNVDIQGAGQSLANTDVLDQNGELVNPNVVSGGYVDSITKAKTFTMGVSGVKGRNTYSGSGSYVEREFLDDGTNDTVAAIDARYARQLSRQLEFTLGGGYSEVLDSQVAGQKDSTYYGQTGLNYQFTATVSGSLSYSYFERDSETDTDDLRENTVSVSLRKTF